MRRTSGFTLVEIVVVLGVIALLATLCMPSFLRVRRKSQNVEFINDLRIATSAFELYAVENNGFPKNTGAKAMPPGMSTYFSPTFDFTAKTPIGGSWKWDYRKRGPTGVSVVSPAVDVTQLKEIDALIDDGNLSRGAFLKTAANRYTAIVP